MRTPFAGATHWVTLVLPPDLPAGEYRLVTGFYTWPELTRLSVSSGGDAVDLATYDIIIP